MRYQIFYYSDVFVKEVAKKNVIPVKTGMTFFFKVSWTFYALQEVPLGCTLSCLIPLSSGGRMGLFSLY